MIAWYSSGNNCNIYKLRKSKLELKSIFSTLTTTLVYYLENSCLCSSLKINLIMLLNSMVMRTKSTSSKFSCACLISSSSFRQKKIALFPAMIPEKIGLMYHWSWRLFSSFLKSPLNPVTRFLDSGSVFRARKLLKGCFCVRMEWRIENVIFGLPWLDG